MANTKKIVGAASPQSIGRDQARMILQSGLGRSLSSKGFFGVAIEGLDKIGATQRKFVKGLAKKSRETSKDYQYGGRYQPEGSVTPINERKEIIAAQDMRQASVANMKKHVIGGGKRPSGVSTSDTTGIVGSYTGVGVGEYLSKTATKYSEDIAKGVVGVAKHFPGYHSAVKNISSIHLDKLYDTTQSLVKASDDYAIATSRQPRGYIYNEASRRLNEVSSRLIDLYRKGGVEVGMRDPENVIKYGHDALKKESAEAVGKKVVQGGIRKGVGRALGYATGIGIAVDIGLAAKWAYDYNKDNPGAVAGHKEALHRKNLKAGSPGKWGIDN